MAEAALQEFHDRAAKMLETRGSLDEEVLDLLFCVEQATQALKTEKGAHAGPSVPNDAEATEKAFRCNSQGQQHFASRSWRAALSCFTEAAQNAPKEAVYHANMAAAALKMCEYHTALQAAQRALCLSPGDQKVRVREAKALEGLQRWALAEETWEGLALRASSREEAAAFKAKQERCKEARSKAEREGASVVSPYTSKDNQS
ncbi:hypothetical protein DUNSADRAFT_899 [Dunaliella salina]|uniref:Uncharacterized protein n=1 Tax=Dunaliella salina TaxID=3046 RepID=A0ABQ7H8R1_DUNSA|nr:hypothetical protein DUNSADRAFT_899 [Dunaliella salina]|eukprot:KAF5843223.1 hypothetical protein DUNSADRAFT_899 [Dunaliella salina]